MSFGRNFYQYAMVGLLGGTYALYKKVLPQMMYGNRNLFLSQAEHEELMEKGETNVGGVAVKLFDYMKYLDKSKKTIVIEMDGSTGLILASELSKTGLFNVICLSKEKNLTRTSSGAAPFYDHYSAVYSPSFPLSKLVSYKGSRLSYISNYFWAKFRTNDASREKVSGVVLRNAVAAVPFIAAAEPSAQDVDIVDWSGKLVSRKVHVFNKRFLLQKMAETLTFKANPDLLINSLQVSRTVFLEGSDRQFVGVVTNLGVVPGDTYILATEQDTVTHAKKFGLSLPILDKDFYFKDKAKTDKALIDEANHILRIGDKEMVGTGRKISKQENEGVEPKFVTMEVTPDGLPITCKIEDTKNCYISVGHGGNAFSLGFATADCLKSEIVDEKPCQDFKYDRFSYIV